MGEHTLKFGGQVVWLDLSANRRQRIQRPLLLHRTPGPVPARSTSTPPSRAQARINIQPTPTLNAKDTQVGLYIQDEWKPDNHWTVNAGIRWDFETNANNNNYVTPTAIADALRDYPGWAARGIDPEDYISDGDNRDPFYGAFQPRLGVSYDVHGDRDLVFFGGAGRYYDRQLFIQGVIEAADEPEPRSSLFFCPNGGTGPGHRNWNGVDRRTARNGPRRCAIPTICGRSRRIGERGGLSGGSVWVLNNKSKMPYSDQFDLGVRKRFGDIQTSLTFSHIRSHNISDVRPRELLSERLVHAVRDA